MKTYYKQILKIIAIFNLVFSIIGCGNVEVSGNKKPSVVRIGFTSYEGIGLSKLIDDSEKSKTNFNYKFYQEINDSNLSTKLLNNELDFAIIDATVAAKIYNSQRAYTSIAIFSLNDFTLITNDTNISGIEDLEKKNVDIFFTNNSQKNTFESAVCKSFSYHTTYEELLEACKNGKQAGNFYAILCEPDSNKFLQDPDFSNPRVLNLSEELGTQSMCIRDVVIVSKNFLSEYENCISSIIKDMANSCSYVSNADNKFINLTGSEFKNQYEKFLSRLYNYKPTLIGGAMLGNDFYYSK